MKRRITTSAAANVLISVMPEYKSRWCICKRKRESPLFMTAPQRKREKKGIERKSGNKKKQISKRWSNENNYNPYYPEYLNQ